MFLAGDTSLELPLTVWTHEWSYITMDGHVTFETAIGGEGIITHHTPILFQASVDPDMGF